MGRIGSDTLADLAAVYQEGDDEYSVATTCFGSDAPLLVSEAFAEAIHERFPQSRRGAAFRHAFSCESNPRKRKLLWAIVEDTFGCLFCDVVVLQDCSGHEAYDCVSQRLRCISPARRCRAGFPREDVSALNLVRS